MKCPFPPIELEADPLPTGKGIWAVESGDLDGDGDIDLVMANYPADQFGIMLNLGDGRFEDLKLWDIGNTPIDIGLADIDRDGDLDAAVSLILEHRIILQINDGAGHLASGASVQSLTPRHWCSKISLRTVGSILRSHRI